MTHWIKSSAVSPLADREVRDLFPVAPRNHGDAVGTGRKNALRDRVIGDPGRPIAPFEWEATFERA